MASGDEHVETPSGSVDGVNVEFTVSVDYQAGTLFVWKNGQLIRSSDDDGFLETGPNTFETRVPWSTDDTVTVRFLEA